LIGFNRLLLFGTSFDFAVVVRRELRALRACAMLSRKFDLEVDPGAAMSACEPNFRLASFASCIIRFTTLTHQIK